MIPKIIHYCWFGGNPKPKSVEKCIKSWKKYCPDYKIIEWNEDNYDVHKNQYMSDAYKEKKWSFVSDYACLDMVYQYGGIYLDTDVQIIKNWDNLLKNKSFFGIESDSQNDNFIALGLGFGAEAKNPLIKKLRDDYKKISFYNSDGTINLVPCPQLNLHVFLENGFTSKNEYQSIDGNTVYPSDYFDPKNFNTGIVNLTENTLSIHQYDASWFDEEQSNEKNKRWKENRKTQKKMRRKEIVDLAIHLPNIILRGILGVDRYEKLKDRMKKS